MRIISLLVAFCFSLNVMANTGTIQQLERHMDEYQYALTVEWDQQDEAFYQAETKKFFDKLGSLITNGGVTKEEIMKMVEAKSKNKAAIEALKLKMSLLSKDLSSEELAAIVKESAKEMYSEGASWNGDVVFSVVIGLVVVAALVYVFVYDSNKECVAYENQYVCTTVSDCYYSGGPIGHYSYDIWGNYRLEGYTCYGPPRSVCGYSDVCTEWVKK